VHGVTLSLLARSPTEGLLYVGSRVGGVFVESMEHLACFYPGLLALAHMEGLRTPAHLAPAERRALHGLGVSDQLEVAEELARTCVLMWTRTPTGIAPEATAFRATAGAAATGADTHVLPGQARGLLRPETAESLFLLHRATGRKVHRAHGRAIWRAMQQHAKLPSGAYATLADVMRPESGHGDEMESFVLSETLKYLYLLFANTSALDLSRWVLTTEAHPLPIA
jgi:mannosyl-oligosaccharide alpha-1,2-mannosidase